MQAGGREGEDGVARLNTFSGEEPATFHNTDNKTGKIIFAGGIKTGHLRGFAANQGAPGFAAAAAHAFDELPNDLRLELAHGEVVEEEKRLGALDGDVVDAGVGVECRPRAMAIFSLVPAPWALETSTGSFQFF